MELDWHQYELIDMDSQDPNTYLEIQSKVLQERMKDYFFDNICDGSREGFHSWAFQAKDVESLITDMVEHIIYETLVEQHKGK